MSEVPKKVWLPLWEARSAMCKDGTNQIQYIRADIVEEMRKALESFLNATGMPDRIKAAQAANKALVEYRGYSDETDKECRRLFSVIDNALEEE